MNRIELALCDQDTDYITMLASYMMEKLGDVGIHIYTTAESFYSDENIFDVALITTDFEDMMSFKQKGQINKKYFLDESRNNELENHIYKYQSAEEIINNISEIVTLKGKAKAGTKKSYNSKLIGVYSPISHELQLPFAMAVGQSLEDHGKVLFLDLEEISIMPDLIGVNNDGNLMDFLYQLSTGTKKLDVQQYIHSFLGFDYINPFMEPDEISQIDDETWRKLFEQLAKLDYENIVVLFGRAISGFSEIIEKFDNLYVLGKPGDYFKKGQEAFLKYLDNRGCTTNYESIMLPMSANNLTEGTYCIEELLQGNLGTFVRKLVA